jgi:YfiH family protein
VTAPPGTVRFHTPRGRAHVRFTTRADGDLNADVVAPAVLATRWRAVAARPVVWLDEEHGTEVVVIDRNGPGRRRGDSLVTTETRYALGIWVGDCAPVAFVSGEGVVAAAHLGWRGLAAGVLHETVSTMRALGATRIDAVVGPCIHAECYEFGLADLHALATSFGATVVATTSWGTPALDLPAAARAALAADGVTVIDIGSPCTACDDQYWSHRARGDRERHGMAVWLDASAA